MMSDGQWVTAPEQSDRALMMARQAIASPGGRMLLGKAVCQLLRDGHQRDLVRDIGARIYQIGGAKTLRAIADAMVGSGDQMGQRAHDELLSGFWRV